VAQLRLFLGLLFKFLQKSHIGEIYLAKPSEVKKMDNYGYSNSQ